MSDRLIRPAVQRTEIGPILATVVPEVLEIAANAPVCSSTSLVGLEIWYKNLEDPNRSIGAIYKGILGEIGADLLALASSSADQWCRKPDQRQNALASARQMRGGKPVTHYTSFGDILEEGMKSGVVMPLKLFNIVTLYDPDRMLKRDRFGERLVDVLRAEWFDVMLHKLARGPNNSLQAWSTDCHFNSHAVGGTPAGRFASYMVQTDEGCYDFSKSYDQMIAHSLSGVRANDKAGEQEVSRSASGGCPVRHATFKKVGQFAAKAFEAEGIDATKLNNPSRVSSISQCRQFVADRVEKIFEEIEG